MPFLPSVPSGKIKVHSSWFKSVRDRIEEIKPIAGDGITITHTTEGQIINMEQSYILNICKDGKPDTLEVYGPPDQ